jgi:hypothetical protein
LLAASLRMDASEYDRRDPGAILAAVASRRPFRDGDVLLVLVRAPYRCEDIVHITALPRARWEHLDEYELKELLAMEARRMPIPEWNATPPTHQIMTVVPRPGFAIVGEDEGRWLSAWLYSNHGTNAFTSDLAVVTEHGWVEFMSECGGREPRLELSAS